jgi:hypothetical protein
MGRYLLLLTLTTGYELLRVVYVVDGKQFVAAAAGIFLSRRAVSINRAAEWVTQE